MTETVSGLAFGLCAAMLVAGAVMMLTTRNVIHAAFWMLSVMLATAWLFLLLSAEFLALVQVMVYAGAVGVLILFVVMLTLRRREDAVRPADFSVSGLVLAAGFCLAVIAAVARYEPPAAQLPDKAPGVAALGQALFSTWALPFELASFVLTVALVGAIWWAQGGKR